MGSSQKLASYITALVLAAFALTIVPSHGILHANLITICSATSSPSLCQKILNNDTRIISANLPELSLISIDHEIRANIKKAKKISHQKLYRDNGPLLASEKLVVGCVESIRINSLQIQVMNKLMVISCETSVSVNQFAAIANDNIQ